MTEEDGEVRSGGTGRSTYPFIPREQSGCGLDWIGLSSVLRLRQQSIGYGSLGVASSEYCACVLDAQDKKKRHDVAVQQLLLHLQTLRHIRRPSVLPASATASHTSAPTRSH